MTLQRATVLGREFTWAAVCGTVFGASRALGLSLAGPGATLPMLCARGACAEPLRDARRPREPPLLEACLGARASWCSSCGRQMV